MSDVVAEAKAALSTMHQGPWTVEPRDPDADWDDGEMWIDVDGSLGGWVAHCQDYDTARFIAAARTLVPALVAEVERLRAAVGGVMGEGSDA